MGAGEHCLFGAWVNLCMSVFIHCFCQSWLTDTPLSFLSFPPGAHYLLLPSNWPRIIVFGNGAVCRDFGVCRGRSGLGPLGAELSHRESSSHSVCVCIFIFQVMRSHCCSSDTPCHTGVQIIIDLAPCLQLAVSF